MSKRQRRPGDLEKSWPWWKVAKLVELWTTHTDKEIGVLLHTATCNVACKRHRMGLIKKRVLIGNKWVMAAMEA